MLIYNQPEKIGDIRVIIRARIDNLLNDSKAHQLLNLLNLII